MKRIVNIIGGALIIILLLLMGICFLNKYVRNQQLFSAVESGDCDAAQTAIDYGADVNAYRHIIYIADVVMMNPTPLVQACKTGNEDMVRLLLFNGANINMPDKITGKTPLLAALHGTKANRFTLASYLIENGADIYIVLKNNSPVKECLFVSKNDSDDTIAEGFKLLQYLIEKDASITEIPFNENALTYATHYSNYNAVDYLIKNKYFGIDEYDACGKTALIVAAKYNQIDIVKLLLSYNANIILTDSEGKTAMDYAIQNENQAIQEMLKQAKN